MLRNDKDVALNAVLAALRKAADHYSQAVELAHRSDWGGTFERLARLRHADAERMEGLVERFGYLPGEPDQDRQDMAKLVTLVRATVTVDNPTPLREKACALENAIQGRLREALALEWPPEALDLLGDLVQRSKEIREEMTTDG